MKPFTSWKATRRAKLPLERKIGAKTPNTLHSRVILHKKAWNVFSKWIRERDKTCITCGSRSSLQAGHFWHGVLDFDPMNINAQCSGCNHFKSGNLAIYSTYLLNKYGLKKFQDLEHRHWIALRGEYKTESDYLAIIDKYKV